MQKLAQSVLQATGKVPTVRLNNINNVCKTHNLYLKLESCNPSGSLKEKNAVYLIEHAEKTGLLKPGGIIIESSSGNFGIGLAMVGAIKGYEVWIVVDAKLEPLTRRIMQAYGAVLIDVPLSAADAYGSMQIARMNKAIELTSQTPGAWYPCQHKSPENPVAHSIYTAREIIEDFAGAPDVIVLGISTSGQLTGIGSVFKKRYPKTKIVGVDVAGSVVLGTPAHPYKINGLGLSFVPPEFDGNLLDAAYSVSDALAFSASHAIAKKEGLLLGPSTGAILSAAISYAQGVEHGKSILMINPDRGDRYLDTVFNDVWLKKYGFTLSVGDALSAQMKNLKPVPESYFKYPNFKCPNLAQTTIQEGVYA